MSQNVPSNKPRFLSLIILALLGGLVAGVLGEIVTRVYIFKDFSVPYLSGDLNVADLGANQTNLVIRNPQKVVVSADAKISETLGSLRPSLVGVFKALDSKNQSTSTPGYYSLEQPLFIGAVITADGWIVASIPTDLKKDFNPKNYMAITSDRKVYVIDELSTLKNLPSDLLIFHLANANNLAIIKMAARTDLSSGQSLLIINKPAVAWPATLIDLQKTSSASSGNSGVQSSDSFDGQLLVSALGGPFKNSLVFDLAGNLSALIGAAGNITPAFAYSSYWQSLISPAISVGRPSLGVNYLDLSVVSPLGLNLSAGALLYPSGTQAAVLKNSPAQTAGLAAGDVISWVNNQEVNASNDLADLIAGYQPGDKITLTYRRGGVDRTIDVKLGEAK